MGELSELKEKIAFGEQYMFLMLIIMLVRNQELTEIIDLYTHCVALYIFFK